MRDTGEVKRNVLNAKIANPACLPPDEPPPPAWRGRQLPTPYLCSETAAGRAAKAEGRPVYFQQADLNAVNLPNHEFDLAFCHASECQPQPRRLRVTEGPRQVHSGCPGRLRAAMSRLSQPLRFAVRAAVC